MGVASIVAEDDGDISFSITRDIQSGYRGYERSCDSPNEATTLKENFIPSMQGELSSVLPFVEL